MPLTKAQCTNCGGILEIDESKDSAVCPFCNTPYIVEKAIQQVTNNTYIQNATIVNADKNADIEKQATNEFNCLINTIEKGVIPFGYHYYKYSRSYYNSFSEEQKQKIEQKKQEFYNDIKWFADNFKGIKDFAEYLTANNLICKVTSKKVLKKNVETEEQYWEESSWFNNRLELIPSTNPIGKIICEDYTDYGTTPRIEGFIPEYGVFLSDTGSIHYSLVKGDSQQFEVIYEFLGTLEKLTFRFEATNTGKNGCYIATCVYGSYDCPEVWTLRRFRDNTLAPTFAGRAFIKLYYTVSPALVKWFGNKKWFRMVWKSRLDSMVRKLNMKGYESTQYNDIY